MRITDSNPAAMYDSVSGMAFGPIADREQLEEFLDWLDREDHADPRVMGDQELLRVWYEFLSLPKGVLE